MSTAAPPAPAPSGRSALFAPHARLGRRGMLTVGVLQALAGLALARAGLRFDGALDVHRTWRGEPVPLATALVDQVAAWPAAVVAALLVLRLWRYRPDAATLALAWGTARAALVLSAPLVLAMPTPAQLLAPGTSALVAPAPGMVAAGLVGALGLAWCVTLLVTGLRQVTAARGWRLAAVVVSVLLAAELASKLVVGVV